MRFSSAILAWVRVDWSRGAHGADARDSADADAAETGCEIWIRARGGEGD